MLKGLARASGNAMYANQPHQEEEVASTGPECQYLWEEVLTTYFLGKT